MGQRYVELKILNATTTTVMIRAPDGPPDINAQAGGVRAPLGYYMMFVLTNGLVPSVAEFVLFQ